MPPGKLGRDWKSTLLSKQNPCHSCVVQDAKLAQHGRQKEKHKATRNDVCMYPCVDSKETCPVITDGIPMFPIHIKAQKRSWVFT